MHNRYESSVEILGELIAFDTTSFRSNLELIDYVEDFCTKQNIPCTRLFNEERTKASLVATIGDPNQPGIVLSGHTDVVPVLDQKWTSDPFTMVERDGLLFGRGVSDMKGFIACAMAMLPDFRTSGKTVHYAFSYDEEVGCLAAPALGEHFAEMDVKPSFAVVGEPTLMQLIDAHKGAHAFRTTLTGLEGHSSKPHLGVNTVMYGARFVNKLESLFKEQQIDGKLEQRFDPPYTTIHVGSFHGGTARNIIPATCEIVWEIRSLPECDVRGILAELEAYCDEMRKEMQAVHPDAGIETDNYSSVVGLAPNPPETKGLHDVMHAAGSNHADAVSYATEAGVFQEHGLPTIICGPGSIDQAHKPDEFIDPKQLDECLHFLDRLICQKAS